MKRKTVQFLSVVLIAALFVCSLSVQASAATVRKLKAAYNGISIVLDGETITPMDAVGKIIEPFTVSGTTYLPLRAVANALGLGVSWDQATKTVTLDSSNPDPRPDPETSDEILYTEFDAFGEKVCTIYMPISWKNKIAIQNNPSSGSIIFRDKANELYGGRLFALYLFSDNSYRERPKFKLLYDIVLHGKTYHLVQSTPTDVQFGETASLQSSYNAKAKEIDDIVSKLVLSPAARPAQTIIKTLNASYPNVKIILDGRTITPKDVNGKIVEPFIVSGTTYLPIRAIASALGLEVDWNQDTKTVILTTVNRPDITPTPSPDVKPTHVPEPSSSTYSKILQIIERRIDKILSSDNPDMDSLWEQYNELLKFRVSEYWFKTMAYGFFTENYDGNQFKDTLDECINVTNRMKNYFDEDEVSEMYILTAKMKYMEYDNETFDYIPYSSCYPDINAMWEKYIDEHYKLTT